MANRISNSGKRKLAILERAGPEFAYGCLVNRKWAFASMQEPAVKFLLEGGYVTLDRDGARPKLNGRTVRLPACRHSLLRITPKGVKYRETLRKQAKIVSR